MVGVSRATIIASYEKYIGDESVIDKDFIQKSLNFFYIYPIKNLAEKTESEALQLFKDIWMTTLLRFQKDDILGKFESVVAYLQAIDTASVDIAASKGLNEADFRALILDNEDI